MAGDLLENELHYPAKAISEMSRSLHYPNVDLKSYIHITFLCLVKQCDGVFLLPKLYYLISLC